MKKQIILILAVLFVGLAVGCNKGSAKSEINEKGYGGAEGYLAAEGLVFDEDNIMYLMDSQTNEAYVMCNLPNCEHDKESGCGACFGEYRTYPIIYNGKIYYLEAYGDLKYTVWEQNIGESSRRKLVEIKGYYSKRFFVAYNGKLYYAGEVLGEDGLPLEGYNDVLVELDLETGGHRYLTDVKEEGHYSFQKMDIRGNTLYYVYNKYDPEYDELGQKASEGKIEMDVNTMVERERYIHSYMCEINLETLEETLYMDEKECESNNFLGVYDEYLVFYDKEEKVYYTLNEEGEKNVFYEEGEDIFFPSLNVLGRKAYIQYEKEGKSYSITYDFIDKTFTDEVELPVYAYIMFYNNVSDCVYARIGYEGFIIQAEDLINGNY